MVVGLQGLHPRWYGLGLSLGATYPIRDPRVMGCHGAK